MSPKEAILDFLNLVFLLLLISFCIVFFIFGDRFAAFTELVKALVPMSVFGIFYLIKIKFTKEEYRRRKKEADTEIVLYLSINDKIMADAITFLTPIILCVIFYLSEGSITALEIIQASLVFIILMLWQKYLFKKSN